jgi:hypothetical protein
VPPETCPNCGADVPRNAKACPECGADEKSGWSDEAYASRLGLPDEEEFDHEEFVKEEFGTGERKPRGISWFWWITALLLLLLLLFLFLR